MEAHYPWPRTRKGRSVDTMIDLEAYLRRIGVSDELGPDLASLEAVHIAHLEAIPFENLDVRLGRPIRLDPESLHAKLIARRRGGYCFEQNGLFASALRSIGFRVETLEARVRPRDGTGPYPRTHMALRVSVGDGDYLADVGFGAFGPLLPVPLDERSCPNGVWLCTRTTWPLSSTS